MSIYGLDLLMEELPKKGTERMRSVVFLASIDAYILTGTTRELLMRMQTTAASAGVICIFFLQQYIKYA